ncbi:MAG: hypothetical protein IT340_07750 [Chloroflexi bacterium]|nr:hypothetical protein [Chloroflexota bacterium]
MSEQTTAGSGGQPNDQASNGGAGRPLRDQLGALGERLDQMMASPEIQEARRRLTQAADEVEARLREAQVGDRIEQSINNLTQQVKQVGETPRGKDIGDRLNQAFATLQQDVQNALTSPRGQELRGKLASLLRDWSTAVEGKRADQPDAPPPDSTAQPKD